MLERVLASLLELSFVLTDREGFVTRWTPRAEDLLGLGSADAAGQPLMEAFGVADEKTPAAGRVSVKARHQDGEKFRTELTFIPVPMSHSLEFNGFLESLESDRPTESVLRRVNSQHSDVLDWIGSVVTDGVPLHSDELTAGTIVAFRPLEEIPWLAEADGAPAPGKPQPALADAVDKAAEVLARSDALERTLDEAGEAVEEARAIADAAHEEASEAARRVSEMAGENQALRGELEQAQTELGQLRGRLDSGAAPASSDELAQLRADIAEIRDAPAAVSVDDLEAVRAELRDLRDAGAGEESAAERAAASLEAVRVLADELRAEVAEAREAAARAQESANEAADAAAVEAKVARVQAEAARVHSEEAGTHAAAAREVAEAWASAAEKHGRGASENGTPPAQRAQKPKKAETPLREARPGFDDAENAMATIGIDGRFQELNPKFSELVGYREQDFHTASWPPVADRAKLDHHREQMRAMLAGEVNSVEVNTGYVHAQGLLVPVSGTLSVERDEDGDARQFLLSVAAP